MLTTEYSWMTSEELIALVTNSDAASALERELAQRLSVALDELVEDDDDS